SPGNSGGSCASPVRKASRKLTSGRRGCSTKTTRKPFASVHSSPAGRFKGRGASGGGGSRRKASMFDSVWLIEESAECGVLSAEWKAIVFHSALSTLHSSFRLW